MTRPDAKTPLRFARYAGPDGKPVYGVVEGDELREMSGPPFGEWQKTERTVPAARAKFLPVTGARGVYALAGNYQDHLAGLPPERLEKFKTPQFFLKTATCLCGHGDEIVYPKDAGRLDYEGELVVVIGKGGRNIPRERVLEHVFGVTAGNDVSARDWQKDDVQWWRAKGSDTFGPCGPFVATGLDYGNLDLRVRVNGEVKMETNTRLLVHDVPTAVSFLSRHVTLYPGDLIFTGTAGRRSRSASGTWSRWSWRASACCGTRSPRERDVTRFGGAGILACQAVAGKNACPTENNVTTAKPASAGWCSASSRA